MAYERLAKAGIGGAALAVLTMAGVGFVTPPTQLPTVTVYHNPT